MAGQRRGEMRVEKPTTKDVDVDAPDLSGGRKRSRCGSIDDEAGDD